MCQTGSRKCTADGIDIDQLHYLNAECPFWVLYYISMVQPSSVSDQSHCFVMCTLTAVINYNSKQHYQLTYNVGSCITIIITVATIINHLKTIFQDELELVGPQKLLENAREIM